MLTFADLTAATGVSNVTLHRWKLYGLIKVDGDDARPGPGRGNRCAARELRVVRALVAAGCHHRDRGAPGTYASRALFAAIAGGARWARPENGRWLVVLHTPRGPVTMQAGDLLAAVATGPRTLIPLWD